MTEQDALAALGGVLDPEVGIDIVNLGLVVGLEVVPGRAHLRMIMTSAACPMHVDLTRQAKAALRKAGGPDTEVRVDVLQQPEWTPERMSDEARRKLGW